MQKPRVIKDFEKLDEAIQEQIKLVYPNGFSDFLISYVNKDGKDCYALPFETDEKYYMIRMTEKEAVRLISEDDDYDDDGILKSQIQNEYKEKYQDVDYLNDIDEIELADEVDSVDDDDLDEDED